MRPLYLDCYLSLPEEIMAQARAVNRVLVEKYGSLIAFDKQTIPHVTIYMGLFPEKNLPEVASAVLDVAKMSRTSTVELFQFRKSIDGYIFWDILVDPALLHLHELVIENLSPLREGLTREKFVEGTNSYSPDERKNINLFGFPWVKELFQPHLTLGKIMDNNFNLHELLGDFEEYFTFQVDRLELGLVGENGVVSPTGKLFQFSG